MRVHRFQKGACRASVSRRNPHCGRAGELTILVHLPIARCHSLTLTTNDIERLQLLLQLLRLQPAFFRVPGRWRRRSAR